MKKSNRNNSRYSNTIDSSFERSIGSLTSAVQTLTDTMKSPPKLSGGKSGNGGNNGKSEGVNRKKAWEDFNDSLGTGGKKMLKGIEGVFGKKAMKKFQGKMFEGFTGGTGGAGKALLGGGLKGLGGGFAGLAGAATKALGPIGAVYSAVKAIYDFMNSGGAAKAAASFGAMFNVDTTGATTAAYKLSEDYRKKVVEYNYMLPFKLQQQQQRDSLDYAKGIETDWLGYSQSLVKDKYEYEVGLQRDAITFQQDQAKQTLDAQLAQRKTLFVTDMSYMQKAIGISERALQAIGSSTQAVLEAVKNVGVGLGTSLKNQISMATSAAGLGAMYMSSADEVLGMSKTFRLMDKSSAKQALNMTAGLKSFAKMNDMEPAQLFKEMADSQEEIFKYTNYTSQEFASQVVMLKNMNTSMSAMAKASDTMVLNYKDSMKAEMSLSAMLGKNVDLSETRARLMSGDMAGGAAALKSALGGMDIGSMNPFAKQQLSQATGMNVDELMNLMTGKGGGAKGTLEQENAKKTGAAIANGALQQDISNAAAKLKLDQEQRAKLLVFEQIQRKGMLQIEQAQRLENLALEQKWRLKYGKLEATQDIDRAVKQMQAEARATQFFANSDETATRLQDIGNTRGMSGVDIRGMTSTIQSQTQQVGKLISNANMTTDEMKAVAQYQADMVKYEMKLSDKGVKINPDDIPKLANYLGGETKFKEKIGKANVDIAKNDVENAKENVKANSPGFWGGMWNAVQDVLFDPVRIASMGLIPGNVLKSKSYQAGVNQAAAEGDLAAKQKQLKAAESQLKAIQDDSKKVDDLKKANSGDNSHIAKQNNQLIGLTATLVQQNNAILEASGKPITLDGKKLNTTLLNQNIKAYGLGNTPSLAR